MHQPGSLWKIFALVCFAISLNLSPVLLGGTSVSAIAQVNTIAYRGHAFLVCTVDPRTEDLRLYWGAPGEPSLHDFNALEARVRHDGDKLLFAANAGMFQPDLSPVGLLILDGHQEAPLNLQDGIGNFYLKPNGVFALTEDHRAFVIAADSFPAFLPPVRWATQSGPLLVHQGEIHPDLIEGSANLNVRSGVGVRQDGIVVFAISALPVNFYDFALFFLKKLKCPNALYLDGHISAFHTAHEPEKPGEHMFGPLFGIVRKT